jgi:protein-disulfide isomerase
MRRGSTCWILGVQRAALGALLLLAAACGGDADGPPPPGAPPTQVAAEEPEIVDLATLGYDEGAEEAAPIRIVEFSDFGCVFCARFHMQDYGVLRDEFVEGGDVVWKYIPVTIGGFPNGNEAALTAECVAEQGAFPVIRDRLFAERESWLRASDREAAELFRGYARDAGVDLEAWEACLTAGEAAERIDLSNRVAAELGVSGTPTFIVQGFPVQGAPALADFQEALRGLAREIREAGAPPSN